MSVTILQVAAYRLGREPRTGADFARVGLAMLGGCERCNQTIAAYNAYPSKSGFWRCQDCIGENGWESVECAARAMFGFPHGPLPISGDAGVTNGNEQ